MPLHLVGENIDKMRAHRQAAAGKLVQLMRGIYVDAEDDIDQTMRIHPVRIAKYLYPNAYLSASAPGYPTVGTMAIHSGRSCSRDLRKA